jgi:hypothetical protein
MGPYDPAEQGDILRTFLRMLEQVTRDGGRKRAKGQKPPWWQDPSHEVGLFSHLYKWKRGDKVDPDSGAHPLVHLAWRALAIAYQETEPPEGGEGRPPEVASTQGAPPEAAAPGPTDAPGV